MFERERKELEMSMDASGLPVSGGVLLAVAAVVGTSVVMGQVMAGRMIDLSGWQERCEADLVANAQADMQSRRKPREVIPELRCTDQVNKLPPIMTDLEIVGRAICEEFDDPDFNAQAREDERRLRETLDDADAKRLARIKAKSGSQCSCAKTVYLQKNIVPLAVYAGTVRTISLPAVTNQEQELKQALFSPTCVALAEVGQ